MESLGHTVYANSTICHLIWVETEEHVGGDVTEASQSQNLFG